MRTENEVLKDIHTVQDKIDTEYWAYTRTARGVPVRYELFVKRTSLEEELEEIRTQIRATTH